MKEIAVIAVPLLAAALAFAWPAERTRPWLLPLTGIIHRQMVLLLPAAVILIASRWVVPRRDMMS